MTPPEAVALAREAGFHHLFDETYEAEADALLAFANLVEARVRADLAPMPHQGCVCPAGVEKTCQGALCPRRGMPELCRW